MIRPVRRLVALMAVLAVASAGMPPVFAAGSEGSKWDSAPSAWFLEEGGTWVVATAAVLADMNQMEPKLVAQQKSKNPAVAKRADRTVQLLHILTAKTPSERHERIRRLPVTARPLTTVGPEL